MGLFSVKWVSLVLHALDRWPGGRCRTGELQRALPGISKKMLVQTLRDVEARGLVARHVFNVVPPKVEYELTPLGKTFAGAVEMLYRWGEDHQQAWMNLKRTWRAAMQRPMLQILKVMRRKTATLICAVNHDTESAFHIAWSVFS